MVKTLNVIEFEFELHHILAALVTFQTSSFVNVTMSIIFYCQGNNETYNAHSEGNQLSVIIAADIISV